MTRTLDEITAAPQVGDVVTMRDGHVRYEVVTASVSGVLLVHRSSVRIPGQTDGVWRTIIDMPTWRDLVFYGASS